MQTDTTEKLSSIKLEVNSIAKKLTNGPIPVMEFPIEVFPKRLQEILKDYSSAFGLNKDLLGSAFIVAYGLAIGNTHKLEIKKGQYEKAILYLSLVGRPTINKSSALKFALAPFRFLESKFRKEYKEELEEWEIWNATPVKERIEKYKPKPEPRQFILSDSTMESVIQDHAHPLNKRGIAMYRDELAGFFKDLNKYRAGSDKENYLSMFNGGTVKVGRTTRAAYINDCFILVTGTIQPSVLREMTKDYLKEGSGLIDRFLFVWPDCHEKPLWNDNEVDPLSIKDYEDSIFAITKIDQKINEFGDVDADVITFKKDARAKLFYWMNFVMKPISDSSSDILAGIYGKFDIHIQRICLILHFIKWSFGETEGKEKISLDTVEEAILLMDFFKSHTDKVQSELNNVDPKVILPDHELNFYNELPKNFSVKDILSIGLKHGKKERAVYDFLKEYTPELFKKKGQGSFYKLK